MFDITLEPGTYVSDNRHKVASWVGGGAAIGSQLTSLAQAEAGPRASKSKSLKTKRVDLAKRYREHTRGSITQLILATNALVLAAILLVRWRRR